MKLLTYMAIILFIASIIIELPLLSSSLALCSAGLFFISAAKDFKKARRLHHEVKADKGS